MWMWHNKEEERDQSDEEEEVSGKRARTSLILVDTMIQ